MRIIVCIKQVPSAKSVKINPETNTLVREGIEKIVNPFDTYAIEEAVRLKERYGGEVLAISMGPSQAEEALREAISMGVDEAYLLCDKHFAGADTWATAVTLAGLIGKIGDFDVIICGKQTLDGDTGQVGPSLAEKLDICHVAYVKKIEEVTETLVRVQRMIEEGHEIVEAARPVLLTVVKEINEPRLPSLKGMMKAKKAEIKLFELKDVGLEKEQVGLKGSPTKVVKVFAPKRDRKAEILDGEVDEKVSKLFKRLENEGIV